MTPNQLKVLAAHDLTHLIPSEEIAYRTGLTNAQVRAARAVLAAQGLIVVHTRRDEIGRVRGKGYVLTDEGAEVVRVLPASISTTVDFAFGKSLIGGPLVTSPPRLSLWQRLRRAFGRAVA